jgi:hypothetical protein
LDINIKILNIEYCRRFYDSVSLVCQLSNSGSVRVLVVAVAMFPVPSFAVILVVYSVSLWICDICLLCFLMFFLSLWPGLIICSVVSMRMQHL